MTGILTLNPDVHGVSAGHIATVFSSSYLNHYLPVTMLSFMGEYSLFKSDPALYHFTNLILHVVNALLLFGLIFALFGNYFVAFLTALLFAVHPLQVESVAWIAERKGVLSATFYFISLLFYVRLKKMAIARIGQHVHAFVRSIPFVKKHGCKPAVCPSPDGLFDGPQDR